MRDASAGTSFLQSRAEIDHRDRNHNHHHHKHKNLHQRQLVDATITQITSTISVIQEIDINENGSTVQVQTWLAASTSVGAPDDSTIPTPLTVAAIALSTSAPIDSYMSTGLESISSVQPSESVATNHAAAVTPAPYLVLNSSSSGSSSTSYTTNQSNYTASSTILSSSIVTTTSNQTSLDFSTSLSSSSSATDSYYSSNSPTQTGAGGAGAGVGSGATGGSTSSTTGAGATGNATDTGSSPSTPAVVGGVLGGIAGIVFIVALLMVFVRWRKRQQSMLPLGSGDWPSTQAAQPGGSGGGPQPDEMTQRSLPFMIPAALASLSGHKPASHQPSIDASSTAGSERGFYRVSGRKLPSVLQHGGDGYGGGHESLSGSSFYRDSRGFYGGPGSSASPRAGRDGRDSGIPITRPSPARTPIISPGAFAPPSPTLPPIDPPLWPDALGRSHPSRDGSHGSRFTEEV